MNGRHERLVGRQVRIVQRLEAGRKALYRIEPGRGECGVQIGPGEKQGSEFTRARGTCNLYASQKHPRHVHGRATSMGPSRRLHSRAK